MKPIIGVVSNLNYEDEVRINSNIIKAIETSKGEPIAIVTVADQEINKEVLELCDGFVFPGGSYLKDYQYKILEYAIKNKIPVLGICLGMELIGKYFFGGECINIIDDLHLEESITHNCFCDNQENKHEIIINKESYMYDIYGGNLMVNSRHNKVVSDIKKPFIISARSSDGLIEAIEWIDKDNYIVGVQFHPEDNEETKIIFNKFIDRALRRKE